MKPINYALQTIFVVFSCTLYATTQEAAPQRVIQGGTEKHVNLLLFSQPHSPVAGKRPENQDAFFFIKTEYDAKGLHDSFYTFTVSDGHGPSGADVSKMIVDPKNGLAAKIHLSLDMVLRTKGPKMEFVAGVITEEIRAYQLSLPPSTVVKSGATFVSALLWVSSDTKRVELVLTTLGDSSWILRLGEVCHKGPLHHTSLASERQVYGNLAFQLFSSGWRVGTLEHHLNVTRGIGDTFFETIGPQPQEKKKASISHAIMAHRLTPSIQIFSFSYEEFQSLPFALVLYSDGLYQKDVEGLLQKTVTEGNPLACTRSRRQLLQDLLSAAQKHGKKDDATAMIIFPPLLPTLEDVPSP